MTTEIITLELEHGVLIGGLYTLFCLIFTYLPRLSPQIMLKTKIAGADHLKYKSWSFEFISCVRTFIIYTFGAGLLLLLIKHGHTMVYYKISDYGYIYLICSPFIFLLFYDFYFYVLHLSLHKSKFLFNYVHKHHHLSVKIRPMTGESTSLYEAIIQYSGAFLGYLLIPIYYKLIFATYIFIMFIVAYTHSGYELTPSFFKKIPILKYIANISTAHFIHHRKINCNYALFTTFWDKLFKTSKLNIN